MLILRIIIIIAVIVMTYKLFTWLFAPSHEGGSKAGKLAAGILWLIWFFAPYVLIFFYGDAIQNFSFKVAGEQLSLTALTVGYQVFIVTAHLCIGFVHARYRWNKLDRSKTAYVKANKAELETAYAKEDMSAMTFRQWLQIKGYRPNLSDHINQLAGWGMFWQWYLFVFILTTFKNVIQGTGKNIFKLWQNLAKAFGKIFQKDQDKNWKDIDKDNKDDEHKK
tara:strand:+ start:24250 stop:24915 length:666 start_codon:yes stop_codon:yes gene_type:complete